MKVKQDVPMFDLPNLRCRPIHMAFLGVRGINLLLEERVPLEDDQHEAYSALLFELDYHVRKNQPFLRGVDNFDLGAFFRRADLSSERGLAINDLLLGRKVMLDG